MIPSLQGHLTGTVPPPPAVVLILRGLCTKYGLPNQPDTGAQSSLREVPGVLLGAYLAGYDALDIPTVTALADAFTLWTGQEELWRNLSHGGPANLMPCEVVLTSDGVWMDLSKPLKNAAGKYQPCKVADGNHFTLTAHLVAGLIGPDSIRMIAQAQTSALLNWLVAWSKGECQTTTNPRDFGWCLEGSAQVAKVNLALGITDPLPLLVAKAIVDRLWKLHDEKNGLPYLTLNAPSLTQADHGYCRLSRWMHSRTTNSLGLWLDMAPWWVGVPLTWWNRVRTLYLHGLATERWIMEQSESVGAPLGGGFDDVDPVGNTLTAPVTAGLTYDLPGGGRGFVHHENVVGGGEDYAPKWDGVMVPFCLPMWIGAARNAPGVWSQTIQPRAAAWWARSDRMVFKPTMGLHECGVALVGAGLLGWKT